MKKLALLMGCVFLFASCEVDDDTSRTITVSSEVTDIDLPEFFEKGETYTIDVTYLLPSTCHNALGIYAERGNETGDEYRDIYVFGMASIDSALTECDEDENADLEEESSFKLTVDRDESYTFHLWTGVNEDNESIFTEIEVPVGEPEDEDAGDNTEE